MRRALLSLSVLVLAACKPDFGDRASLVSEPQILAVRAEPAEAKPGEVVTYSALVASPDGSVQNTPIQWAFCATPKLLTENDIVSAECLRDGVRPVAGAAPSVQAQLPADGCALFGPEIPPGDYRPRDPDPTGGYFQPMRASYGGAVAFGMTRISCNLANAPADAALDFKNRYVANENPKLSPPTATVDGAPVAFDRIPPGARVRFSVAWAPGDAESYVAFDPATQTVVTRRESMRVSWFATAGAFDSDRTGRVEDEPESFTENGWQAPARPGTVHLWLVLRDSRGGVDFAEVKLEVAPR
jgi:hypothetical protein